MKKRIGLLSLILAAVFAVSFTVVVSCTSEPEPTPYYPDDSDDPEYPYYPDNPEYPNPDDPTPDDPNPTPDDPTPDDPNPTPDDPNPTPGGGSVTKPDAPTGVSAEQQGSTAVPRIYISWNSVSGATSYNVYRSTSANGSYSKIGESDYAYYYDTKPKNGDNYYKVKAYNSAGLSPYSDYASYNYDANGYEPCPPTITGSAGSSSITLRWSFPSSSGCGAPTSIVVKAKDPSTGSWVEASDELSGTATTFTFHVSSFENWANASGWIFMSVTGTNSHGSDSKSISYNYIDDKWM